MKRRIIHIEESRCNGCGLRAAACHEGAIEMVNARPVSPGRTTATGWGTACPPAPPGPSPLRSVRPPPTTMWRSWPPRRPGRELRPALRLSRQPEPGHPPAGSRPHRWRYPQ